MKRIFNIRDWSLETIALRSFLIGFLIVLIFFIRLFFSYKIFGEINEEATSMVGTFIGGISAVFFSGATIILVYLTYKTNREELVKLNTYNEALTEFNRKQILFNQRQTVISTFNDLLSNVRGISDTFNNEKVLYFINDQKKEGSRYDKHFNNFKIRLENDLNRTQIKLNENINFKNHILEIIKSNPNNYYQAEYSIKLIVNAINETLNYLSINSEILDSKIYLNKLKSIIIKGHLRRSLLMYGLVDSDFKKIIEEYSLFGEINTTFLIVASTKGRDQQRVDFSQYYDPKAFSVE